MCPLFFSLARSPNGSRKRSRAAGRRAFSHALVKGSGVLGLRLVRKGLCTGLIVICKRKGWLSDYLTAYISHTLGQFIGKHNPQSLKQTTIKPDARE